MVQFIINIQLIRVFYFNFFTFFVIAWIDWYGVHNCCFWLSEFVVIIIVMLSLLLAINVIGNINISLSFSLSKKMLQLICFMNWRIIVQNNNNICWEKKKSVIIKIDQFEIESSIFFVLFCFKDKVKIKSESIFWNKNKKWNKWTDNKTMNCIFNRTNSQ